MRLYELPRELHSRREIQLFSFLTFVVMFFGRSKNESLRILTPLQKWVHILHPHDKRGRSYVHTCSSTYGAGVDGLNSPDFLSNPYSVNFDF